jgi:hypothetical protein
VSRGRKPRPAAGPGGRRVGRPVLAVLLTLGAVAGLLFGLARLGDEARRRLGPRDRYTARFADVECDAPPGLDRPTFLAEVRYAASVPESFQLLDPELPARLAAAFAVHPWVESVTGVDVAPPARVRVRLRFRTPVLAVPTDGGVVRLVDAGGVLLPATAPPAGLPELVNVVPPPVTPAGQVWADDTVKRAAELVTAYRPARLERTPIGWRLTQHDGKVLVVK